MTWAASRWPFPASSPRVDLLVGTMRARSTLLSPLVGRWQGKEWSLCILSVALGVAFQPVPKTLGLVVALALFFVPSALRPQRLFLRTLPLRSGELLWSSVRVGFEWALAWALLLALVRIPVRFHEWSPGGSEAAIFLLELILQAVVLVGGVIFSIVFAGSGGRHDWGSGTQLALFFQAAAAFFCLLASLPTDDAVASPWVGGLALAACGWIVGSTLSRRSRIANRFPAAIQQHTPPLSERWWVPAIGAVLASWLGPRVGLPGGPWIFFSGLVCWQLLRLARALGSWRRVAVCGLDTLFGCGVTGAWWGLSSRFLEPRAGSLTVLVLVLVWHGLLPWLERGRSSPQRGLRSRWRGVADKLGEARPKTSHAGGLASVESRRSHLRREPLRSTLARGPGISSRWTLALSLGLLIFAGGWLEAGSEAAMPWMMLAGALIALDSWRAQPSAPWLRSLPLRPVEIARWRVRTTLVLLVLVALVAIWIRILSTAFDLQFWNLPHDALVVLLATAILATSAGVPTHGHGLSLARLAVGVFQGACVLVWRSEALADPGSRDRWTLELGVELPAWGLLTLLVFSTVQFQLSAAGLQPRPGRRSPSGDLSSSALGLLIALAAAFWLFSLARGDYPTTLWVVAASLLALLAERAGLWGSGDLDDRGRGTNHPYVLGRAVSIGLDFAGVVLSLGLLLRYRGVETDPETLRLHLLALYTWFVVQALLDRSLRKWLARGDRSESLT